MTKPDGVDHTEKLTAAEMSSVPPGCVLYVAEGLPEDRGRHITLRAGTATVGTGPNCDLQLNDPKISRAHAEFMVTDEGVALYDRDSTNGTFYLGNRIDKALLKHGARLRIGKTVVAVLPLPDGAGIAPDESTQYGHLVGASLAMRQLYAVLRRLESSEAPVLILGETGTGKELVARTLHDHGPRKGGPFAVVDCGAIPGELIDSELFGHVRGAFTGATGDRAGVFEEGDGGTLFLDEIGELPLEMQPRLLRVLETGQVRRVGANSHRDVDVRVLAATHRDLGAEVEAGRFREDLYFRVAVVPVAVPPLRARPEDIPILARHIAAQLSKDAEPLPDGVLNLMSGHDWPGNVRELRNAVQRLLSLGELVDLPEPTTASAADADLPYKEARERVVGQFEAEYVRSLLERHEGNISAAARSAGIARGYFRDLMRKHGLYEGR